MARGSPQGTRVLESSRHYWWSVDPLIQDVRGGHILYTASMITYKDFEKVDIERIGAVIPSFTYKGLTFVNLVALHKAGW